MAIVPAHGSTLLAIHYYGQTMAAREWWGDDPRERYWMEITDRSDLGADLHAPQRDDGGNEYWSYTLVRHVLPGDIIFHWWKIPNEEPALVGWSRAVGDVHEDRIVWTSHGSYGRVRPSDQPEPSWLMPLQDFTELPAPIRLADLRTIERPLLEIRDQLELAHGSPLYFPFVFSETRPLRPAQEYLVKFPRALVEAIGSLQGFETDETPPTMGASQGSRVPGPAGWVQDPVLRRAIERHAVDWTLAHFGSIGYNVEHVGDRLAYDVLAVRADEELHIEVKGTTTECVAVELTSGEVDQAEAHDDSVLVVVDQILVWRSDDGTPTTSGGRVRVWHGWTPEQEHLTTTRYRYTLPIGWVAP